MISDTDLYAPGRGDALWAWKSFLRGRHPILMDFGIIGGVNPPDPSAWPIPFTAFEPARDAMGDTLPFAERTDLIEMEPRGDLSSTGYALANPGKEYLVLQPNEPAAPLTLLLEPGSYSVEWFGVEGRETVPADDVTVETATHVSLGAFGSVRPRRPVHEEDRRLTRASTDRDRRDGRSNDGNGHIQGRHQARVR